MGNVKAQDADLTDLYSFIGINDINAKNQVKKLSVVKGFYDYLQSRNFISSHPIIGKTKFHATKFRAYIYSTKEFKKILDAVDELDSREYQFRSMTFKTILILLFNTGIRIGEAVNIKYRDIDFKDSVLMIKSKNDKTRIVPLSKKLTNYLCNYVKTYKKIDRKGKNDFLFTKKDGKKCSVGNIDKRFRNLCDFIEIKKDIPDSFKPRIHDIRHTFAVYRLIDWYRKKMDLNYYLPYLSTYLGHTSISGTQTYLAMIPELLSEANSRFEQYFLTGEVL